MVFAIPLIDRFRGMGPCVRRNDSSLSAQRALRVHIERIDRLARRHEQAVALHAAEAEVGAALWQGDEADRGAVGREHHDTVEIGIAHAPAAPEVAVASHPEAVQGALAWAKNDWRKKLVVAGHFADNPASGQVLVKAGFLYTGVVEAKPSVARGEPVDTRMMIWLA